MGTLIAFDDCVVWEASELALDTFINANPDKDSLFDHRLRIRRALASIHWFASIVDDEVKVRVKKCSFMSRILMQIPRCRN